MRENGKVSTSIRILVYCIVVAGAFVAFVGIFSDRDNGQYTHESVRGQKVELYGKGIYHHMSAEVAPQGIAQDYVTLLIGIPLLLGL